MLHQLTLWNQPARDRFSFQRRSQAFLSLSSSSCSTAHRRSHASNKLEALDLQCSKRTRVGHGSQSTSTVSCFFTFLFVRKGLNSVVELPVLRLSPRLGSGTHQRLVLVTYMASTTAQKAHTQNQWQGQGFLEGSCEGLSPACAYNNTAQCCVISLCERRGPRGCAAWSQSTAHRSAKSAPSPSPLISWLSPQQLSVNFVAIAQKSEELRARAREQPAWCETPPAQQCTQRELHNTGTIDTIEWPRTTPTSAFCAHLARAASSCSDCAGR